MSDKKIGGHILPERMDRFTWHDGEIKILGTKAAVEEQAKKECRKVTWYDSNKKTALYGAIIGDIVGSRFEGKGKKIKTKDFELFAPDCRFTDDTVMTVAVAEIFLQACFGFHDLEIMRFGTIRLIDAMQRWGRKYPHAGFGGRFKAWLFSANPRPYNSFGNGSAMRVSAVGWYADRTDWVECAAHWTARPIHDHPEGIKGAKAVAAAICLARTGHSKEEIKSYIETEFDYDLSRSLVDVRKTCIFNETCPISVPEAIIAFLESTDFEDAIRNAVSLGGDSDTQAAIAGSIAEAFYLIPDHLIQKCREYLPSDMLGRVCKV